VRVLMRSFVVAVGLVLAVEISVPTADAASNTSLPFDPATLDTLTPEQRQQALESLGIQSNGEAATAASGALPDVSRLTPEQRQRLLEQLQRSQTGATATANDISSAQSEMSGARARDPDSDCDDLTAFPVDDDGGRWSGDDAAADRIQRTDGDRRTSSAKQDSASSSAYARWLKRDRCRVLAQRQASLPGAEGQLKPFGYDLFSDAPSTFAPANDIPVPSDYVLGPNDTVRVQLFGNENRTLALPVGRDGSINMPKLGPMSVVGQRFDDIRAQIEDRVEREIIGTSASVSLGDLRSVRVFVLGDVPHPGSYTVSSLATISNALLYAGGVSPVGSLRKIQLKRDGQLIRSFDLYDLLLHGDSSQDSRLLAGDVVFVPPVGRRIAIDGEVKRPAIYEIKNEQTLAQAIGLAGGVLASSLTGAAQVQRFDANRKRSVSLVDISQPAGAQFQIADGDQVRVRRLNGALENSVAVVGAVVYPGIYQWSESMSLADALSLAEVPSSNAQQQVYLPLGLIERTNTLAGAREIIPFNLHDATSSAAPAVKLQRSDRIVILTRSDIQFLDSREVRDVVNGKIAQYELAGRASDPYAGIAKVHNRTCRGLDALAKLVNSQRAVRYTSAFTQENPRSGQSAKETVSSQRCPRIFDQIPDALPFLLDASVSVYGEVQAPGLYPVTDDSSLSYLLDAAGGLTREANRHSIEYVSSANAQQSGDPHYDQIDLASADSQKILIRPGDSLNVRPLYTGQEAGTVRLGGELRFPGSYGILRNERLSEVLRRAGGLTPVSYPYGAVFTRQSAREAEFQANQRAARDLQDAIATAITSGAIAKDAQSSSELVAQIVRRLQSEQPIGRVVIEADPTMLQLHPEQDPILEPGDAIFIPKRPVSVTVIGQVLNPGSVQFVAGQSARSYIDLAGGYGQSADESRTFVILPNGTAQTLKTSFWNFKAQEVPPGSVIVVPRDAAPFNLMVYSERIFGILGNLALTSAALLTITKN
jgi:polysaccharide export outer membrane protein